MRNFAVALVAGLALASQASAQAVTPLPSRAGNVLETDGQVTSIQRVGDELMLSGYFGRIGPYVGSGVAMDPGSGAVDPTFPRLDGQVSDVIDDGNGGWYVGGQFLVDGAGKPRYLMHVLASGAEDPAFKDTSDDFITALALADGRLYATRYFDRGIRIFDAATGARYGRVDNQPERPSELELADGRLYIGGYADVIAIDLASGARVRGFSCDCGHGQVSALAHDGTRLYVGRRGGSLTAVDLDTGAPDTSFAPGPGRKDIQGLEYKATDKGPLALLVDGNRLLVGGSDLQLGGPSTNLVALDKATGTPDPSFANGYPEPVHDMVLRGNTLVVSGAPSSKGPGAPSLTTFDRATGEVRDSISTALNGTVDALAGTGSRLFVGGRFRSQSWVDTKSLALVDASTGKLVPTFAARANLVGSSYEPPKVVATDSSLIFWRTSQARRGPRVLHLRALSRETGAELEGFHPPEIAFNPYGKAMFPGRYHLKRSGYGPVLLGDGDDLYVGHVLGDPTTVWPQSRIEVLSATTGQMIRSFDLPLKGYVTALAMRDGTLYAGGSFRRFRFGHPAHLATLALNPETGAIDSSFDAHSNGPVYGIGVSGQNLYLTGIFKQVGAARRVSIAAVDARRGFVDEGFRVAGTRFSQTFTQFGPPLPLDDGVLNVGPPSGYYPFTVAPVDAATGNRIPLPFKPATDRTLLPVGDRFYAAVREYLTYENYTNQQPTVLGFLPGP